MKRVSLSGQIADIDLKLLRVFKAVVESGGFSAAEVELNVGRSAISRFIADLESRLDMRLCERGRSGFALTERGSQVYNSTLELLQDLEKFRANVNLAHSKLVGELNLGLTDNMLSAAQSPVVEVLGRFHQEQPDVKFNLQVCAPNEVECGVVEGRFHLGVVPKHHALPSLNYRTLYSERSQLYCGTQHSLLALGDEQLTIEKIGQQDFISPNYNHSIYLNRKFPQLKAAARSYQVEGVATLILSGQYLGFLPDHYAQRWVDTGQMQLLLPEQLNYEIPFALISRKDATHNVLINALLDLLLIK
ncbi:MAG: DNA-binding transcriptional LysR family regulator [Oceanospirillaceae bacterium]|jgi:DNA-binding transcriptional LysR family regulator